MAYIKWTFIVIFWALVASVLHYTLPARDVVRITATSAARNSDMLVHMLRIEPERTARITRGENAGHTLTYANVTEDWKILREWDGVTDLDLEAQASGDAPVVVMVQVGRHGPILAAAQIR